MCQGIWQNSVSSNIAVNLNCSRNSCLKEEITYKRNYYVFILVSRYFFIKGNSFFSISFFKKTIFLEQFKVHSNVGRYKDLPYASTHVKVLHSICQQIWKTQQWPQDWKRSVFIPSPKKGNAKECSNCHTVALISHASKVILKILQARLRQYVKRELTDIQAGFTKGRRTRDQIAHIDWIIEKARESKKYIYFCFIDYAKAFDCVDHNKLWKILQDIGMPDHFTCLLKNLYAGQEETEADMEQRTCSKLKRSMSRLCIVTLLI